MAEPAEPLASDIQYYAAAIRNRIQPFWVHPPGSRRDLSCTVGVQLLPSGDVVPDSVRILSPSGDLAYDRSVVAAIYKASPLPVPTGRLFDEFRDFKFVFKP